MEIKQAINIAYCLSTVRCGIFFADFVCALSYSPTKKLFRGSHDITVCLLSFLIEYLSISFANLKLKSLAKIHCKTVSYCFDF